ncbi:MAG TPA: hypothetical protein VI540_05190 [Gaiellaceae bacterium]|nr:hypothetical protein [Gaiellaceae bacterium]
MDEQQDRRPSARPWLYAGLVTFVLAWILGPQTLRDTIPIWLPFLIALGLELSFFAGAFRPTPHTRPDRGPQPADRELYGYPAVLEDEEAEEGVDTEADEAEEPAEYDLPERPRGSPVRRLAAGLAAIAALALLVWFVESRSGWDSLDRETRAAAAERFSDEASVIAEKPVTVRCDESGDFVGVIQHADGAAQVGGDTAYLTPAICLALYRLAFEDEIVSSRTARAIAVLAHEAWHLRGVRDEGETECYALQSGVGLGQRLGLSEDRARQMMRQQLTENALRAGGSFEYRVPPECRDEGRLDLAPDDSRFP